MFWENRNEDQLLAAQHPSAALLLLLCMDMDTVTHDSPLLVLAATRSLSCRRRQKMYRAPEVSTKPAEARAYPRISFSCGRKKALLGGGGWGVGVGTRCGRKKTACSP